VARAARFHTNQARLQFLEERKNLPAPKSSVENNLAVGGDAVCLKDVLGQVQADCGNLHFDGSSCLQSSMETASWRIVTPGAGAIHSICS
jgi:hypothetical protein